MKQPAAYNVYYAFGSYILAMTVSHYSLCLFQMNQTLDSFQSLFFIYVRKR